MRWLLLIMVFLGGCTLRPPVTVYRPTSEQSAVQAWSDAFNADDIKSLQQLVHPLKKGLFDQERPRVKSWVKSRIVKSYLMGSQVRINQTLVGQKVTLHYHDGRKQYDLEILVAEGEDRWWIWSF